MPRVNGVMQLLPGTYGAPNTTIKSAPYNAQVDDFVAEMNSARPLTAGGTGGITAVAGADNLSTTGADIASATTTDIGAATGVNINITGTTTITGFGTKTAGVKRWITFAGALTLTHNATSLILPTGANITTAAGDTCLALSLGGGNWRVISYQLANGSFLNRTITLVDAGATVGPTLTLFRDSASPANADLLGRVLMQGRDSAGNIQDYAEIYPNIVDATSGTEDAQFKIRTVVNGVMTDGASFGGQLASISQRLNVGETIFARGGIDLNDSGHILVVDYGQIHFPSLQNASSDAKTLDDFERGTFTPTLAASGCTFSYTGQTGKYTKVGNQVTFNLSITLNTSGNTLTANALSINGLPYVAGDNFRFPLFWLNAGTAYVNALALLASGGSSFNNLRGITAANATIDSGALVANALLSATLGSRVVVTGTYLV